MKLFISWSGERSKQVALAFRKWLPTIIQGLKPWISDVDLEKGSEWNQELSNQLEGTAFGLFCLTPESLSSRWLLFEAGAIAKRPGTKRVYTLRFGLADNDVPWPLAQFQSTNATKKADVLQMLSDINRHVTEPLENEILRTSFERGWTELEADLGQVPQNASRPTRKGQNRVNAGRNSRLCEGSISCSNRNSMVEQYTKNGSSTEADPKC